MWRILNGIAWIGGFGLVGIGLILTNWSVPSSDPKVLVVSTGLVIVGGLLLAVAIVLLLCALVQGRRSITFRLPD